MDEKHISISRVIINNFQKHKHKTVSFSDFTAITGKTNHGKTSIIRAIKWCLYNTPNGDKFITNGEDKCSVTVVFSNGTEITRTRNRSGSINCYDIIVNGKEPIHLEGFGSTVPDEVIAATGMAVIDLFGEKQSPNICEQLSAPFFIGEKPIMRGVLIGRMGNLDVVDSAIKSASSDLRAAKSTQREYKAELKEIKSELSNLTGLTLQEKRLKSSKSDIEKCQYLEEKLNHVNSVIISKQELEEKLNRINEIITNKKDVLEVIDTVNEAMELSTRLDQIKSLSLSLKAQQDKLKSINTVLSSANKEDLDLIIDSIDKAISISKEIEEARSIRNKIKSYNDHLEKLGSLPVKDEMNKIIQTIEDVVSDFSNLSKIKEVNSVYKDLIKRERKGVQIIENLKEEYDEKVNEYGDKLSEAQICPVCENKITLDQIKEIKNKL